MGRRVALVSGSNKGIGFATVRSLCKTFDGDVILTARDVSRGQKAVQDLQQEGLHPQFHLLDVLDRDSIQTLKTHLEKTYDGLDVLVNNAGIQLLEPCDVQGQAAAVTMKTNYWALKDVCEELFPILRPHARVVNITTLLSRTFVEASSPDCSKRAMSANSVYAIDKLATEYEKCALDGTLQSTGWYEFDYAASKAMVRLLTPVQQRSMDSDLREDIIINCCCPGYTGSDMTNHRGILTIDQAADTPVYLATLPRGITSPKGEYVFRRNIDRWQ